MRILVISRQPPYGSSAAREALDLGLAAALFDQQTSILLMDDAVFQLLPNQNPGGIEQKNLGSVLQSLPMYDIEQIYVAARSLEERGLDADHLCLPVTVLTADEIKTLIQSQDRVFHV